MYTNPDKKQICKACTFVSKEPVRFKITNKYDGSQIFFFCSVHGNQVRYSLQFLDLSNNYIIDDLDKTF